MAAQKSLNYLEGQVQDLKERYEFRGGENWQDFINSIASEKTVGMA